MKVLNSKKIKANDNITTAKWTWPDSLDAIKAAPLSHKIIYEDSSIRILYVTVNPGTLEPVHTHKWRSLAWAVKNPPFTLYHYKIKNNRLLISDSFTAELPINKVNVWEPDRHIQSETLV